MLREQLKLREWFIVLFLIGLMITLASISRYAQHRIEGRVKAFQKELNPEALASQ